jgi:hypothetical protein
LQEASAYQPAATQRHFFSIFPRNGSRANRSLAYLAVFIQRPLSSSRVCARRFLFLPPHRLKLCIQTNINSLKWDRPDVISPSRGREFAFFMHAFGKALEPKLRPRRINSMPHLNNKVRLAKIYGLGFETAFDAVWLRALSFSQLDYNCVL